MGKLPLLRADWDRSDVLWYTVKQMYSLLKYCNTFFSALSPLHNHPCYLRPIQEPLNLPMVQQLKGDCLAWQRPARMACILIACHLLASY